MIGSWPVQTTLNVKGSLHLLLILKPEVLEGGRPLFMCDTRGNVVNTLRPRERIGDAEGDVIPGQPGVS